jgi:hypothetical protein
MKTYGWMEVYLHAFLTSALDGGELSASSYGSFTPGERVPNTHCIGSWVGSRAGLDAVVKRKILAHCRETIPGRPARSLAPILTELPRNMDAVLSDISCYLED